METRPRNRRWRVVNRAILKLKENNEVKEAIIKLETFKFKEIEVNYASCFMGFTLENDKKIVIRSEDFISLQEI